MDRRAVGEGTALVAYVPVLHRGYLDFFGRYQAEVFGVLGPELQNEFDYLRKEIRALTPDEAACGLQAYFRSTLVLPVTPDDLHEMNRMQYLVIMPDDDVSRTLICRYLPKCEVRFEPVFLRWDRTNTLLEHPVVPDRSIAPDDIDAELMTEAAREATRTSICRPPTRHTSTVTLAMRTAEGSTSNSGRPCTQRRRPSAKQLGGASAPKEHGSS
jgi:dCMP deaminase